MERMGCNGTAYPSIRGLLRVLCSAVGASAGWEMLGTASPLTAASGGRLAAAAPIRCGV